MRHYTRAVGTKSRIEAWFEDGTYRWQLSLRGLELQEYSSQTIPDRKVILYGLRQKIPTKMRGCACTELQHLSKAIKESMKYLENATKSENNSKNSPQQASK
jgi:hypothetical protein